MKKTYKKWLKKQLIGLCLNLIYERDSQIKEKEFIYDVFNKYINSLKKVSAKLVEFRNYDMYDIIEKEKRGI